MIRVVFVSDQPLSALGFRTLLRDQPDLELVAEFTSEDDILDGIETLKPEILILDCYLLLNPSEFIVKQISNAGLDINIVILNQIIDEQHFRSLYDAGVKGYLLTSEPLDTLLESIHDVAVGQSRISVVLESFLARMQPSPQDLLHFLTTREKEVLTLISNGFTNTQIAEKLCISMGTVKNHSKSIYKKINVHTRVEAVLFSLKNGLVINE
jgi:DNA-binding NarL/FixJ family response regulator